MEKISITLRLPSDTVARLDYLARIKPVSRQDFIAQILTEVAATVGPMPKLEQKPLPPLLLETIEATISQMKLDQEISLKKLIGTVTWATLNDPVKRALGKEFKELVVAGEFPGLKISRKKSNNEQQYKKL